MLNGKKVTELRSDSVVLLRQDWKEGLLPAKVIALKYGVDLTDLRETALREQWLGTGGDEPPLQQQIEQATLQATVERVVSDDDRERGLTEPRVMTRDTTIKQFSMIVAGIESQHRAVIKRAREYVTTLLNELETLVGPHIEKERIQALARLIGETDPEYVKLLESRVDAGDIVGGLRVLDKKAQIITKLTWAMKDLLVLERAAYGLDKPGGSHAGYDELLEEIHERRKKR